MKTNITFFLLLFSLISFAQTMPCGSIIYDTFDDAGALPSEWTEYNTTNRVTIVDGELKFDYNTTKPSAYRTFTPLANDFSYAFDVKSTRNYVICYMNLMSSSGKILGSLGFGMNGNKNIRYASSLNAGVPADYTGGLLSGAYASNTTYSISLNANFTDQTINFYNNGELMAADVAFLEDATDIAKIDIQLISMYSNEGRFFFDNVSLIPTDENRINLTDITNTSEVLLSNAFVGDNYGQYSQSAIDDFQAAVNESNAVLANCNSTATELVKAQTDLEAAKAVFNLNMVNNPVLKLYSGYDFSGTEHEVYCGYYNGGLGEYEDWAVSFTLEKGYMATFAQDINGLGVSKVYVAQDDDLAINLPADLQRSISFIRVSPWYPVGKKGSLGDAKWASTDNYNATWHYNWSLSSNDKIPGVQFVPMSWNTSTSRTSLEAMEAIGKDMSVNHLMAFNEPDNSEQSNLTVAQALEAYPQLLASGLRLGAPGVENVQYSATKDEFNDGAWIQEFMDSCVELGYRVDFIPAHDYIRRSKSTFIERFKGLHDRYNLPIWVTEFNYGNPNMGSANITEVEGYNNIKGLVETLEESDFIERYNWYYFFGSSTGIGGMTNGELNITGQFYRYFESPAPSYIQEAYEQGQNLSVTSFETSHVGLYPNPVIGGVLTINYANPSLFTNAVIKLYNIYGIEVLQKEGAVNQIDVSHLSSGIYLVQIASGDVKVTKKIIIASQE